MHKLKLPKILQPFDCDDLIRLGKSNDGGYLVNQQDILKTNKLVSFGIGEDFSFEQQFLNLNNCGLTSYDSSVDINKEPHKSFFVDNKIHIKQNIECNNLSLEQNTFLKCDIEGSEFNILNELINQSSNLTGLVIEFHEVNRNIDTIFNFISKVNLKLIHLHINNYFYYKTENGVVPDILELSFTSSRNIAYNINLNLPHILDMPNNPNDLDFEIKFV